MPEILTRPIGLARSFLASLCQKEAPQADIVVTSNNGYPLDQNIYQAVKGMSTAEVACRKGGVIVIAARCEDGSGGEEFWRTFREEKDPKVIMDNYPGHATG